MFVKLALIAVAFASSLLSAEVPITKESIIETIPAIIDRIGLEYSATTTEIVHKIAWAESNYRNVCNTKGCLYGIGVMQIVQSTFDEQCDGDVYKEEDNIRCGFKMVANEDYWRWKQSAGGWIPKLGEDTIPATCSCVKTARNLGANIPYGVDAGDLKANAHPGLGALALFRYSSGAHVAVITEIQEDGFFVKEGNFELCKLTCRFIQWNDLNLVGFWR